MSTHGKDELRNELLRIDTTYNLGDKTTTAFLPPSFYIDRLVDFITSREQSIKEQAEREAKRVGRLESIQELIDLYEVNGMEPSMVSLQAFQDGQVLAYNDLHSTNEEDKS